ncbi:MAG: 6-carboxytetrahydropterin synthase [Gammaproteobacteria bacterium]|nr:6-carboxytetrahydropterin synthase [Gammaproteobacteria bacterium]
MTTLFVEQLTVIDFSYFDPERGIVGESWIMDVELGGSLDANGMVFDFAHVKKQIKAHVDQLIDHKFVVPSDYSKLKTELDKEHLTLHLSTSDNKTYVHTSPIQAVTFIPSERVDIKSATPFIQQSLQSILPSNVEQVKVTLREEAIDGAFYHYSHGLKRHFGDCQRIAHGHRSKIMVYKNGQRDESIEKDIAEQWKDIYLITQEDLVEQSNGQMTLNYSANQGRFSLTLPESVCDIIDTDSTVELIAEHLADKIKQKFPNDDVLVKAFEGVQKGAIASR